jgi:hypothetical protein
VTVILLIILVPFIHNVITQVVKRCLFFANYLFSCAGSNSKSCYCPKTEDEYRKLQYFLNFSDCNNVFVRNPELLILNAALSIICLISVFILLAILSALIIGSFSSDRYGRRKTGWFSGERDFTFTV